MSDIPKQNIGPLQRTTRATIKRGLAQVSAALSNEFRAALDPIIERLEVLDGVRGEELDRAVTLRDLIDSGYTLSEGVIGGGTSSPGSGTPGGGGTPSSPTTPGPTTAPTDLTASSVAWFSVILTWTPPSLNLEYIEVWRNSADNIATASHIATVTGALVGIYTDYVGENQANYYWIRAVGTDGVATAYFPAGGGVLGTTGEGVGDVLANLEDAITVAEFAQTISPIGLYTHATPSDTKPSLPNSDWPVGSYIYTTDTKALWSNVAENWVPGVDTNSLADDAITTGKLVVSSSASSVTDDPFFEDPTVGVIGDTSRAWVHVEGSGATVVSGQTSAPVGERGLRSQSSVRKQVQNLVGKAIDADKVYRASGWARNGSSDDYTGRLYVDFFDSTGARIYGASSPVSDATGWISIGSGTTTGHHNFYSASPFGTTGGSFKQLTFSINGTADATAPTNAKTMVVGVDFHNGGTVLGNQNVYNLRIDEVIPGELIVDGSITAGEIQAGAIGATEIAADAITASKIAIVGDLKSLNADTMFTDPDSWFATRSSLDPGDATAQDSGYTHTSSTSQEVGDTRMQRTLASGITDQFYSRLIPINPAKTYRVSAWITASGSGKKYYLAVPMYNGSKAFLTNTPNSNGQGISWGGGSNPYWKVNQNVPVGWTYYEQTIGAGASGWEFRTETRFVSVGGHYPYSASTSGETVYITDLRLEEVITASLLVDGTITATQIDAGTITANEIKTDTITANEIDSNTITANEILTNTITAAEIFAGTITANEIDAGTITANEIDTGTITAASGIIADLAVETLKIADNAVTLPESNFTDGTLTYTSSVTFILTQSKSIVVPANASGQPILIWFTTIAHGSGASSNWNFELRRDGSALKTFSQLDAPNAPTSSQGKQSVSIAYVDSPTDGTYTYAIYGRAGVGGKNVTVLNRYLSLSLMKK